jgi:hypothetical protein
MPGDTNITQLNAKRVHSTDVNDMFEAKIKHSY